MKTRKLNDKYTGILDDNGQYSIKTESSERRTY